MQIPSTPADISLFEEEGVRTFRNDQAYALYSFDRDRYSVSHCSSACAEEWPPLLAPVDARIVGEWQVVPRTDAKRQWAYRGMPVYTYSRDRPGGNSGDGVGGVWHLVKP